MTTLRAGDPVNTMEEFDHLPSGAVIAETNGQTRFVKAGDNLWTTLTSEMETTVPERGIWLAHNLNGGGYYTVEAIPVGKKKIPAETLARYQWRFRMHALRAALENGVGMQRVHSALAELGVTLDSPDHPAGPGIRVCREEENLPEGVLVFHGSPDHPARLAVWVRERGTWRHVFGGGTGLDQIMTVATWPGVDEAPAWLTAEGGAWDKEQIAVFKARAFRVGDKLRRGSSWCGTYDAIMERIGVTANAVSEARRFTASGFAVGDVVTQAEAAQCPVGTVFGWIDPNTVGRFAVFQRIDEQANPSQTRRVWGSQMDGTPLGNYRSGMRILMLPATAEYPHADDWSFRLGQSRDWMPHLPVGSIFRLGDSLTFWHVTTDGSLSQTHARPTRLRRTGPHSTADFVNYHLYLIGALS